jgi:hypothetical protein
MEKSSTVMGACQVRLQIGHDCMAGSEVQPTCRRNLRYVSVLFSLRGIHFRHSPRHFVLYKALALHPKPLAPGVALALTVSYSHAFIYISSMQKPCSHTVDLLATQANC